MLTALEKGPPANTIQVSVPEGGSRAPRSPNPSPACVATTSARRVARTSSNPRRYGARGAKDLEGFLWPSTYEMKRGQPSRALVDKQLASFKQNFAKVSMREARWKNLTPYEVLIIASLVERETAVPRERKLIASVIYNRLAQDQSLGIDATVRFFTENWDQPLKQSELNTPNPYNTRLNKGLPPGPIGNPGLASIRAAASPSDSDYLFYVANPCEPGHAHVPPHAGRVQRGGRALQPGARGGGRAPRRVADRRPGAARLPSRARRRCTTRRSRRSGWPRPGATWRCPCRVSCSRRPYAGCAARATAARTSRSRTRCWRLSVADEAPAAAASGAANTLTFADDGAIHADNTDVGGCATLSARRRPRARSCWARAGRARGVVLALREAGADVAVWNRTPERASALAARWAPGWRRPWSRARSTRS